MDISESPVIGPRPSIEKRNASFGRRGYDLRQAMEERLDKLNAIGRQQALAERLGCSGLIWRNFP